jgi:hypothetical protein
VALEQFRDPKVVEQICTPQRHTAKAQTAEEMDEEAEQHGTEAKQSLPKRSSTQQPKPRSMPTTETNPSQILTT